MGKKKAKKQDKSIIIGVCVAVVAVIAAIVAVVISIINSHVDEGYFASDAGKQVIVYEVGMFNDFNNEVKANKVYAVYKMNGDEITSEEIYYRYDDAATASEQMAVVEEALMEGTIANIQVKDEYVIVTFDESVYQNVSKDDVMRELDFVESIKETNQ